MDGDWVQAFRDSVSWADLIRSETIQGQPCCSAPLQGETHYWCPGLTNNLSDSVSAGEQVRARTGCKVTIQFLDRQAEPRAVEAALRATAQSGLGCSFLEPQPCIALTSLLMNYSEGSVLDGLPL